MLGTLRDRARGGAGGALAPPTFSDGKFFFFTSVIQIYHLPHKQGLVIWQYWTPTNREQKNFVL